ncbi:hypothetical protein NM688_g5078 [Phlebia brevispora]|uniref:Uncharacterized protein n=1 Tax=Phlebia brevispora TaxID=194682 RepID=A0ACC1T195_9APHY|nr:hypothetical protein NM688_g5078 [Phlebia brevispora]
MGVGRSGEATLPGPLTTRAAGPSVEYLKLEASGPGLWSFTARRDCGPRSTILDPTPFNLESNLVAPLAHERACKHQHHVYPTRLRDCQGNNTYRYSVDHYQRLSPMHTSSLLVLACVGVSSAYVASSDTVAGQSPLIHEQHDGLRPAITPELSASIDSLRVRRGIHGVSIGIVRQNGDTEYGSWGIRTEDGDPTTPDTLFQIGQGSQAFLSAALGILIDDFRHGRNVTALPSGLRTLNWNTGIQELFPDEAEWKLYDHWATEKVTLRDILTHVTGITAHDFSYKPTDTPLDVIRRLRYMKPTFELRQNFQYVHHMYILAVHIVETYSGMALTSYVHERIFKPLHMTSTTYFVDEAILTGNMSHAFTTGYRRIPYHFADRNVARLMSGAGAIISSATDMSKWLAMLLNRGVDPYTHTTIVPPEVYADVTRAYSIIYGDSPSPTTSLSVYSMGWARYSYRGQGIISHPGVIPGFLSYTGFLPLEGFGVVILLNNGHLREVNGIPELLFHRIVEEILGLPRTHSADSDAELHESLSPFVFKAGPSLNLESDLNPFEALSSAPQLPLATSSQWLPLEAFSGTYTNPIYGLLTLCSPKSTSLHCHQVFKSFGFDTPRAASPGLYAEWPTVWTRHMLFTQWSMFMFGVGLFTVHPSGYGKNETPFVESDGPLGSFPIAANFMIDDCKGELRVMGFNILGMFASLPRFSSEFQIYFDKVDM